MNDSAFEKAALYYMRQGFSVIPTRPADKKPCIKWQDFQHRRADEKQISEWAKMFPDANVAIVTGEISNLLVVDCDTAEGIQAVEDCLPDSLPVPTVTSPSGGRHYWFLHRDGLANRARVMDGVDIRTTGGYIICPPSKNGRGSYTWLPDCKISEVARPALPESLLIKMQTSTSTKGTASASDVHKSPQTSTGVHIAFTKGHRDETLFSIAHHLAKGGMPADNIKEALAFLASKCDPPFPKNEVQTKIQSAMSRLSDADRNLAAEVREWILSTNGHFLSTEVHNGLQVSTRREKKTVSMVLTRLVDEGLIERTGTRNGQFRKIEGELVPIDFAGAESETVDVWLPFRLHDLVEIMPGNTILLAGESNAGKTALLLNIIRFNQERFEIHYFNSEMGDSELKKRLKEFDDMPLSAWNFHAWERSSNFADVIRPGKGKINIVDYLELHDDFYKVGGMLNEIHRKLKGALAIVALQKNPGTDVGLGGFRTLEKPRLALAIEPNKMKIRKAKNWRTRDNPNGLEVHYKIIRGCNLSQTKGWHRPAP